jgi:hypothetical protein
VKLGAPAGRGGGRGRRPRRARRAAGHGGGRIRVPRRRPQPLARRAPARLPAQQHHRRRSPRAGRGCPCADGHGGEGEGIGGERGAGEAALDPDLAGLAVAEQPPRLLSSAAEEVAAGQGRAQAPGHQAPLRHAHPHPPRHPRAAAAAAAAAMAFAAVSTHPLALLVGSGGGGVEEVERLLELQRQGEDEGGAPGTTAVSRGRIGAEKWAGKMEDRMCFTMLSPSPPLSLSLPPPPPPSLASFALAAEADDSVAAVNGVGLVQHPRARHLPGARRVGDRLSVFARIPQNMIQAAARILTYSFESCSHSIAPYPNAQPQWWRTKPREHVKQPPSRTPCLLH